MNEAHGHDEASGVKRRRYVPDCGTSTHKFLSYAAAIQTRKFYRPGRESAGELVGCPAGDSTARWTRGRERARQRLAATERGSVAVRRTLSETSYALLA